MPSQDLKEEKNKGNKLAQARLEKTVVNVGVGRLRQQAQFEEKILPEIEKELSLITGQKPSPRPAKKAISGFKTRIGDIIGLKITLRGKKMNDFVNRLINIIFPRVKDFKGIDQKNIDQKGNLNVGLKEQYVFPEISADKSKTAFGLQITFITTAKTREEAVKLYKALGFPLK